jgi:osmotically-inducible protein OsmY
LEPESATHESFAGRGPKGYRRSDERIEEEICERLTVHPAIDASEIEVSVSNGDVTLKGTVNNRAEKHLTESMTETVSGVKEVYNQLRITQPQAGVVQQETQNSSARRRR